MHLAHAHFFRAKTCLHCLHMNYHSKEVMQHFKFKVSFYLKSHTRSKKPVSFSYKNPPSQAVFKLNNHIKSAAIAACYMWMLSPFLPVTHELCCSLLCIILELKQTALISSRHLSTCLFYCSKSEPLSFNKAIISVQKVGLPCLSCFSFFLHRVS